MCLLVPAALIGIIIKWGRLFHCWSQFQGRRTAVCQHWGCCLHSLLLMLSVARYRQKSGLLLPLLLLPRIWNRRQASSQDRCTW
jgi:hypothetical protein